MCNYSAEVIKCQVIDWLIATFPNVIIGNEVMYGQSRKVVDLLAIIDNELIAFEIKSEKDSLKRLPGQLDEYRKIFDKTFVVSSTSHYNGVLPLVDKRTGLILVDSDLRQVVSPTHNHSADKLEMLNTISLKHLRRIFPQYRHLDAHALRLKLCRLSKRKIHELLINFQRHRISKRYAIFMNERGEQTLVDDIPVLSSYTTIERC